MDLGGVGRGTRTPGADTDRGRRPDSAGHTGEGGRAGTGGMLLAEGTRGHLTSRQKRAHSRHYRSQNTVWGASLNKIFNVNLT